MLTARVPARLSAQEVCMWANAPIRTRRRRRRSGGRGGAAALSQRLPMKVALRLGFFFRVLFCFVVTRRPDRRTGIEREAAALFSHDKDLILFFSSL